MLTHNNLRALIRAHQMQQKGFKFHSWDGVEEFPPCITVFSAPNYGASGNDASIIISDGENVDVRTFAERKDKPFQLPERPDAFKLFFPEMTFHIIDMITNLKRVIYGRNRHIRKALNHTDSMDPEYLSKVI